MDKLLATTLFGLEEVLAAELREMGAKEVVVRNRLVSFSGNKAMMYRANYHARTALRILRALRSFPSNKEDDIYKGTKDIQWERYLGPWNTLAVDTVLVSARRGGVVVRTR
jgi:putative N6-adenine-specific DNA methylase